MRLYHRGVLDFKGFTAVPPTYVLASFSHQQMHTIGQFPISSFANGIV